MLRIGICDDSADARVALRAALERALERRRSGADTSFFEFSSAGWAATPGSWTWYFWTLKWGS